MKDMQGQQVEVLQEEVTQLSKKNGILIMKLQKYRKEVAQYENASIITRLAYLIKGRL